MLPEEVLDQLRTEVKNANELARIAAINFNKVIRDTPSGLPHPDGTQRIKNVSRAYHAALRRSRDAFNTLHNYMMHGVVPEAGGGELTLQLVCTLCHPREEGEGSKPPLFAGHCTIHGEAWHRKP